MQKILVFNLMNTTLTEKLFFRKTTRKSTKKKTRYFLIFIAIFY